MKGIRLLQGMVLVCILMIPILIILFLRNFGTNEYEIPVLYETGVEDPFGDCQYPDSAQHFIPEFTFVSQDSSRIGREDMEGKITIVDFFFTSCPSICPIMSNEMNRVQDAFREREEVQIFSISIDPEYDSPEVLAAYADRHEAKKGKWFFLNGPKDEVYDLARCGFILPTLDGKGIPEDFVHSDKFALIDEKGRIRGYYSGTNREDVDLLILETKILLYGKG
ncbi:SCO family protein [Pararhodonellum marinum]|uniref:SCO family protein n=1 Tax=Pararhodonellum marinum TaxID=2755358 RepID=UPI0018902BEC|nr:SCO family protein [Pararhodonellum marinum]